MRLVFPRKLNKTLPKNEAKPNQTVSEALVINCIGINPVTNTAFPP